MLAATQCVVIYLSRDTFISAVKKTTGHLNTELTQDLVHFKE